MEVNLPVDVGKDENGDVDPWKHHQWSYLFLPEFL